MAADWRKRSYFGDRATMDASMLVSDNLGLVRDASGAAGLPGAAARDSYGAAGRQECQGWQRRTYTGRQGGIR